MGRYRVVFHVDAKGRSQAQDWLDNLKRQNPKLHAFALRLLRMLEEQGPDLRPPLAKPLAHLGAPIWELRHRTGIRLYYWRQEELLFVVAAGEVKDQDSPDPKLLELAVQAYKAMKKRKVN
ncbi:type II toxin-antitoxin system RelE/ParE family toxin [Thermus tenuipuniceus]|uniref:type II toxin-antitoxin system RelE/ParE family toxin n=1 Tax=Thermus tenuipuniceus TaxID=2078690 RepID=UPI000CF9D468|nr:type II toxin-antitoxin system RelE/ParE family toxin [Thermus tenuipuniceus]